MGEGGLTTFIARGGCGPRAEASIMEVGTDDTILKGRERAAVQDGGTGLNGEPPVLHLGDRETSKDDNSIAKDIYGLV